MTSLSSSHIYDFGDRTYDVRPDLGRLPADLKGIPHWLLWRPEPRARADKPAKKPYRVDARTLASVADERTWASFEEACEALAANSGFGLGFVLGADGTDDLLFIDLDGCRDPETGDLDGRAAELIRQLNGYTEVSASGRGIHIIVRWSGTLPSCRVEGIEAYQKGRYLALTGDSLPESCAHVPDRQAEVELYLIPLLSRTSPLAASISSYDVLLSQATPHDTSERIDALRAGKWQEAGYDSQSEADLAYLSFLAARGNRTPAGLDEAFRRTGLYREKWDEPHSATGETYGERTIARTLSSYEPSTSTAARRDSSGVLFGNHDAHARGYALPWEVLPEREEQRQRYGTGLTGLDHHLQGGLLPGGVYIEAGPPGAGKSTLLTQVAAHLSKTLPVFLCSSDDAPSSLSQRLAQACGMTRGEAAALTRRNSASMQAVLKGLDLRIVDESFLRAPSPLLKSLAAGREGEGRPSIAVFCLDSIQSAARKINRRGDSGIRSSVTVVMDQLKALAETEQVIVLATSQVNRASYRGGRGGGSEDLLSAGAESSAIEFDAGLFIHLKPHSRGSSLRYLSIEKSRLGPAGGALWLELRDDRAFLEEPTLERLAAFGIDPENGVRLFAYQKSQSMVAEIVKVVEGQSGLSFNGLYKEIGGSRKTFRTTVLALLEREVLENRGTKTNWKLFLKETNSDPNEIGRIDASSTGVGTETKHADSYSLSVHPLPRPSLPPIGGGSVGTPLWNGRN